MERALEVRQHFGLADDGYAFENYADVMSAGGHALAAQWVAARPKAEEGLLAAGAKAEDSGLGSAIDESELRDSKTAIWRRYRLKFPTEVRPADTTVSRVSRDLSKRMLCVFTCGRSRYCSFN